MSRQASAVTYLIFRWYGDTRTRPIKSEHPNHYVIASDQVVPKDGDCLGVAPDKRSADALVERIKVLDGELKRVQAAAEQVYRDKCQSARDTRDAIVRGFFNAQS